MTRFEREISGSLGEYWKKSAQREVDDAVKKANKDASVDSDGAIKWISNGNYIPDDFCEKLEYAGYAFDRKKTGEKRDEQTAEMIKRYREEKRDLSDEEELEMKTNFKKDDVIMNVLTRKKYKI